MQETSWRSGGSSLRPGWPKRPWTAGWPMPPSCVVDGRIESVGPQATLPSDAGETSEVHDLGDVSLLPGFIETHIHMHYPSPVDYREIARPEPVERMLIRAAGHMRDLLLSGATTARDTGSRDDVALAIRSAIQEGLAVGPRLLVAGAPITTTAGHYWFLGAEADTTEEVVRRVRERRKLDVDCVKIVVSGGGYTPGRTRVRSSTASRRCGPPSTRRIAWDCRSWPIP